MALVLEGFIYFSKEVRPYIVYGIAAFLALSLFYILIKYLINGFTSLSQYNYFTLARKIERFIPEIGDTLLNTLQLQEAQGKEGSQELIAEDIHATAEQIKSYEFSRHVPNKKIFFRLKILAIEFALLLVIIIPAKRYFLQSGQRLLNPAQHYPIPKPFNIENISQDTEVLGGEDVQLTFRSSGQSPTEINLSLDYGDYQEVKTIPLDSAGNGKYTLENVRKNVSFRAYVTNNSPFIPWNEISSERDTVVVTNRPKIVETRVEIDYPKYTGKSTEKITNNTTEYFVLPGSRIYFQIESNKILEDGKIEFLDTTNSHSMNINGKEAYSDIKIKQPRRFKFRITDKNNVENINPIEYEVSLEADEYPELRVRSPGGKIDLNEQMNIPIKARVSDDFGISKMGIEYRIEKKYGEEEEEYRFKKIPLKQPGTKAENVSYDWNMNEYSLGPEDKVSFQIVVFDNDRVNGPKKTASETFTAVFPSLNQMYSDMKKEQEGIEETGEEVVDQLKKTREVVEKVQRKLLKKEELSWEQKEQVKDEIEKTQNLEKKVNKINEKLDTVINEAQKNNLFDKETLKKYSKLQETFQQIMTPELKQAMQDLQKAVENVDQKETQQALKKFETNREQFEKELEQKLKLYQRIKAEQQVDEIVKRMKDLSQRQKQLNENMDRKDQDLNKLSDNQEDIRQDTKIAEDMMERTEKSLSELEAMPEKQLKDIRQEMENSDLDQSMKQTQQKISKSKIREAKQSGEETAQKLEELSQRTQEFRKSYRKKNMQKMTQDFNNLIYTTITISKQQENLKNEIEDLSRQSSKVIEKAVVQDKIRSNIEQLMGKLSELSGETFGMPTKVQQVVGRAYNQSSSCIKQLEERNPTKALGKARNTQIALNMAGKILISSLNEMQSSQSSTGFQNYMKKLKQLAKKQRKLNKQTKGMKGEGGQMMPQPGGGSALQRLAARQKQIQKSLRQLQKQRQGSGEGRSGELEGANKEMEKVIEDLENNQVLQKTLNKQDKILTRMLDAQKSLRKRGFQKKRKSEAGEKSDYVGPDNLPENRGEIETLLNKRLEQALDNNYSQEYEEMIRRYFDRLMQDESNSNKKEQNEE